MGGVVSSVCSAVKTVVSDVYNGIKTVITDVHEMATEAVKWVMEKITGISEAPSYEIETASPDQTKKINELIKKCVSDYGSQAKKFEEGAQFVLEGYMNNISESLEPFKIENIVPDYVFKSLKQETDFLKKNIENIYSREINNVFSLNNNDLLDILRLSPGKEKENKLQNLAINTLEQTHSIFVSKIKGFLNTQQESIIIELKKLKEARVLEGCNIEKEFNDISEKIKSDSELTSDIEKYESAIKKIETIKL